MMDDGRNAGTVGNDRHAQVCGTWETSRRQGAGPRIAAASCGVPAWEYRYGSDRALRSNMQSSFRSIPRAVDAHASNPMRPRRRP